MNKQRIELVGRVTAKPEVQKSKSNKDYCKFGVAVNRKTKDKDGKENEVATFYNILTFNKGAERSSKLKKGQLVRVVGDLEAKPYTSKDGDPRVDLTVFERELQAFDAKAFK